MPPCPVFDLSTVASRERALDALGAWFVAVVIVAEGDRDACIEVMRRAIVAFYDIREAGDQPRGMYAGHFFLVDGVGIESSDRPVPWFVLAGQIGRERAEVLVPRFDEAEKQAR